jgi:type II secretory pathway component PulF
MSHQGDSEFRYRALLNDGGVKQGVMQAPNTAAVIRILSDQGLWALSIQARRGAFSVGREKRQMASASLALGLRMLADFLEAGLSLARSLAAFEELAPNEWKSCLPSIRESVRQGKSFAAALGAAPIRVASIVVGVIQAGEGGSGLALGVRHAAEMMEEAASMRSSVRGALAYPLILAISGVVSLGLLVGVVLPKFAAILADLGQALPATTQLVLEVAAFWKTAWIPAVVGCLLAVVAWRSWAATDSGRLRLDALLLRFPLIGPTRLSAATARICGALAALLSSGVSIAPALVHAARAGGDAALGQRLREARAAVVRGERLSKALAATNAMTASAIRLVGAGEESGRLASMLAHAARLEREDAVRRTRAAVRLIEPSLIIVFGILVAFIAAAMLQALYSVRPGV